MSEPLTDTERGGTGRGGADRHPATDTPDGTAEDRHWLVAVLARDGTLQRVDGTLLDETPFLRKGGAPSLAERMWWSRTAPSWLALALERAIAGVTTRAESHLQCPSGRTLPIEMIVAPCRDAAGEVESIIVIAVDISDRRQAEDSQRNNESLFRQVVESAPSGLLMVDRQGQIVLVNTAAEQMFGFARHELIGRPVETLVPQGVRPAHAVQREGFQKGATRRAMGGGKNLNARRRDGSEFPVEIGLNPIVTDAGEWVLSAILDVTARQAAQAELERALEEKTALLNEVHHRVKNNLQVVSSLLNLQAQHAPPDVRAALEVSQSRLRAMGLIHQLLYESRDYRRVHLGQYFRRLSQLLREVHGSDRTGISLVLEGLDAPVYFDLTRTIPCALIVTELVTNAYKHAFPGGRRGCIRIEMAVERDSVRLVVADDGVGPPEGFRIDGARTLGYQLLPELVDQARGTLTLHCDSGTRAEIWLHRDEEVAGDALSTTDDGGKDGYHP